MGLAGLRRRDHALLLAAAVLGAALALMVGQAMASHMHEYKTIHHGLGQEPGEYAHPFTTQVDHHLAKTCVAVGAAGAHWYYTGCVWADHNHSYQTNFHVSSSSAHIEGVSPVIDHHHHFPH